MRRKTDHVEIGDSKAIAYAQKYAVGERELAIRAFRHGWQLRAKAIPPIDVWDLATEYAHENQDGYDFFITRVDVLAGYNQADEYRQSLNRGLCA